MLDVAPAQAARHGRAGHVRHVRDNSNRVASDLVRACHPVGVNDGMRGPRGTAVGSGAAFRAARRRDRLTPGINSASDPTSARQAAHVTHSTPRNSGSRDCGSAGYGCAPVNRRRRPVTEGGVCVRSVESLIGLPKAAGGPRLEIAYGTKAMTITAIRRARYAAYATAGAPCRWRRRTDSRRYARRGRYWSAGRTRGRRVRGSPMRRTQHPRR